MKAFGFILLWTGFTLAAASYQEEFKAQADASRPRTSSSFSILADTEEQYTCTKDRKCELGCCGPL
jgi:hypothetical protein